MAIYASLTLLASEISALNGLARSEEMTAPETQAMAARCGVTRATAARWWGEQANPRNLVPVSLADMRPDCAEELRGRAYATRLSIGALFNGGYRRPVDYDGATKFEEARFANLAGAAATALDVMNGTYEAWLKLSWFSMTMTQELDGAWLLTIAYAALTRANYMDAKAASDARDEERAEFIDSFEGDADE